MEDLLVMQGESIEDDMIAWINDGTVVRLLSYRKRIQKIVPARKEDIEFEVSEGDTSEMP